MEKIWLKSYPEAVPKEIQLDEYTSVVDLVQKACRKYKGRNAFELMGAGLTFEDLDFLSNDFAAFLQSRGLKKGDRIAMQLPNILQYPIALVGALKAGLVVVNTNPLYTAREMKHQFNDSGAQAIVILTNCAHLLEEILSETQIKTVVTTGVGDMLGWPKSLLVNSVLKYVKKLVPNYKIEKEVSFYQALDEGHSQAFQPVSLDLSDLAFLQYTGGTTGVSKGAMLTHGNVIGNCLQIAGWMKPRLIEGQEISIAALPLYHIFALTLNGLAMLKYGATNILVPNPKDISGFIKTLKSHNFTVFPGLNTLFNALMNHPDFENIDFSNMKVAVAGGMALQQSVAKRWLQKTGKAVVEGYGLTEASPVVCCNPIDGTDQVGTIGMPLPSTEIRLIDEEGKEVTQFGERGELCARGPQVMKGYWQRPDETSNVLTEDGWLKTGDVGIIQEDGYVKIVDRIKDMILVSGFNVFPNEIEEVVSSHEKVLEVAAVGIPDPHSTEIVKVFIVKKDDSLTEAEIIAHCKELLTGYKIPKAVEFRTELPKNNVGKILRRLLRPST